MNDGDKIEQIMKMEEKAKYFLFLIRYGAFGKKENIQFPKKPEDIQWKDIFVLSERHSLVPLTYQALSSVKEFRESEVFEKWEHNYHLSVCVDMQQKFAWEEIKNYFSRKNIKLLPLKGIRFKELYPKTELRTMGDLDILYEKKSFSAIKAGMEELGYTYNKESAGSNHQVFSRPPFLQVEMHSGLLPVVSPFSSYYSNPWKNSRETEKPFIFRFSIEDEYIFMLIHAYKHFYNAGSGVRTILDFRLFTEKYGKLLNREYIENEIQKANAIALKTKKGKGTDLKGFEALLSETAEKWFGKEDIEIDKTTIKILSDGVYGRVENIWKKNLQTEGRSRYLWNRLFPPFQTMKTYFPTLEKLPFLLPLYYLKRIFRAPFKRRKEILTEYRFVKEEANKKRNENAIGENSSSIVEKRIETDDKYSQKKEN